MQIVTTATGASRPFERDRRMVLRAIPQGASIVAATATITPVPRDDDPGFPERISFAEDGEGDWGAVQRCHGGVAEVDLRSRRRLAEVAGTGLDDTILLVDQGGGWLAVDRAGRPGGDGNPLVLAGNPAVLPGLAVTGVRLTAADAEQSIRIDALGVSSPPSNVTLALDDSPTFFTHVGDLVDPATTADFSHLLQEALARSPVVDGHHEVGFVVHSDSIARLDVTLDIEVIQATQVGPSSVDRVSLPFTFGTVADVEGTPLELAVAPGQRAVPGASDGRVQGSFEATRVVAGPTGRVTVTGRSEVDPGRPHAQPLVLDSSAIATSLDLLLAAVSASVDLAVDVVADLDGKPGRESLLPAMATARVSRDDAPDLTWVNVALPGEVELPAGIRHWIVLQARDGRASWAHASAAVGPDLQTSPDDGLAWRAAGTQGPVAAHLRLRHVASTFRMPVDLRVAAGGREVVVDLQHLSSTGQVDFSLDLPALGTAINQALDDNDAASAPAGEHVANGTFTEWLRAGDAIGSPSPPLDLDGRTATATSFSPDGATLWVVTRDDTTLSMTAVDTYCRLPTANFPIGPGGIPADLVVHPSGRRALVLLHRPIIEGRASNVVGVRSLVVVDLASRQVDGGPIDLPVPIAGAVADPTGTVVNVLVGPSDGGPGPGISRIGWDDLSAMATGAMPADLPIAAPVGHSPVGIDVAADGSVLTAGATDGRTVVEVHPPDLRAPPDVADFEAAGPPRAVALAHRDQRVVVVEDDTVAILRSRSSRPPTRVDLPGGPQAGRRLVRTDPVTGQAWVGADTTLARLDPARQRFDQPLQFDRLGFIAVSPSGNRLAVTTTSAASTAAVTSARLLPVGSDLPGAWEVTAGTTEPSCFGDPPGRALLLGGGEAGQAASAISQVVAVRPDTLHRLAVDAVAAVDDATVEVLWRDASGGAARTDVQAITAATSVGTTVVAPLRHDSVLRSPPDAVAAEVRLVTPEAWMVVGMVSLAGADSAGANPDMRVDGRGGVSGWSSSAPSLLAQVGPDGTTVVHNHGTAPASLSQHVPVVGETWRLGMLGRVSTAAGPASGGTAGEGASVVVTFVDDKGDVRGPAVSLPIMPLDFDRAAVQGVVPPGTTAAVVALAVPSGTAVELEAISLVVEDPVGVTIDVVSEAPGSVLVSGATVALDTADRSDPPTPVDGLPAPTAPGAEPMSERKSAHCCACGRRTPVESHDGASRGRGAPLAPCGCGQPRVVAAQRPPATLGAGPSPPTMSGAGPSHVLAGVALADLTDAPTPDEARGRRPALAGFAHGTVALPIDRAVVAGLVVRAPLTAVDGIGPARAAALEGMGIGSLSALAAAAPRRVAAAPGVSDDMAHDFIRQARALVRSGTLGLVHAPRG